MSDCEWSAPKGSLYRLGLDRHCARIRSEVVCSNGTGWSPDGRTMYHTESFRYAVFAYDFDGAAGVIANRRAFVQLDSNGGEFPDGLTVDGEGFVWSAHDTPIAGTKPAGSRAVLDEVRASARVSSPRDHAWNRLPRGGCGASPSAISET